MLAFKRCPLYPQKQTLAQLASKVGMLAYKSSSTRNLLRTANSAFSPVDSFVEDDARSPDGAPADITRCALCHRNHSQMNDAHAQSPIRIQEVTMSLLQRTGVYQKTDHWHPAFTPSGVMTSDVSEVTETDEDVRILNARDAPRLVPDDVREMRLLRLLRMSRSPLNMWPPKSGVATSAQNTRC